MKLNINGREHEVEVQPDSVSVDGTSYKVNVWRDNGDTTVRVGGRPYKVKLKDDNKVVVDGRTYSAAIIGSPVAGRAAIAKRVATTHSAPTKGAGAAEPGSVSAPMPGKVRSILVSEGQQIAAGTVVAILEAMKMENEIRSPLGGKVMRIAASAGQAVSKGDTLVVVE